MRSGAYLTTLVDRSRQSYHQAEVASYSPSMHYSGVQVFGLYFAHKPNLTQAVARVSTSPMAAAVDGRVSIGRSRQARAKS
jgi:hypothetical protein